MVSVIERAQALVERGHALRVKGDAAGAERAYRAAMSLVPKAANPPHNIGLMRCQTGDFAGAERMFRRSLKLDPSRAISRNGLGTALLGQGRLAEGFPLHDAWRELPERQEHRAPEMEIPRWRGEDVAGKRILIWSEEGFGDQIMFARYAVELKRRGAQVGWVCPPELVRLLRDGAGLSAVAPQGEITLGEFEFYIPSSSLPIGFGQELPAPPYLAAPPIRRDGCRIGVFTHGNPNQANDANRRLPPDLASRLLALPGAVSLHPEETGARDFYDTASIVAGLDQVISVDSAPAHLAGAMGKPVWVLLSAIGADWRWLAGRDDSPWYPSARLYRQEHPGDWGSVIERVCRDLIS